MTGRRRFGGGCLIRQSGYRQTGDSGPGRPAGAATGSGFAATRTRVEAFQPAGSLTDQVSADRDKFAIDVTTVERSGHTVNAEFEHFTFRGGGPPMRRWTMLVVALGFVLAFGTGGYAQTPSGTGDKMDKDKMMGKDKMMDKDKTMGKDKMMDKDKMMGKDKMMDKKDDKMMDKKQ